MPLQATSGAASYDAFGGGAATVPQYIEDVFSTYLYTGNNGTQTIANGLDLTGKGGLVWIKDRTQTWDNLLVDSARGNGNALFSNTTSASTAGYGVDLASNGFNLTSGDNISNKVRPYASWAFREQPKFFDVVTYTGNGSPRTIAHNLGSVPGCIIVKRTDSSGSWRVYHRSLTSAAYMVELNTSSGEALDNASWNSTAPTSTVFTVGSDAFVNASGGSYVAYLFAHDSAGFGLLGTDNVISCGAFTTNGSGVASVNLGYEPQWVVAKAIAGGTGSWFIQDNMRGFTASPTVFTSNPLLKANDADPEATFGASTLQANATGFTTASATYDPSVTYIYIAIRRGPMKVPTDATKVFNPVLAATTPPAFRSSNFNSGVDSGIEFYTPGYPGYSRWSSRLTGVGLLATSSTAAETTTNVYNTWDYMNGYFNYSGLGTDGGSWMFKRAPGYFDEVCYTGTGVSSQTFNHNLGVVPELMIVKCRSQAAGGGWVVYSQALGNNSAIILNSTGASFTPAAYWNTTSPTASVFSVNADTDVGNSGRTYVNYLFATCAGVSKVGSYTGTGTTLQVNCGFTSGARFVLIKRTDSTGDWYVWDSARGIVAGNDPYLLLNSTAAEVTGTDYVDTYSAGFEISSTAPAAINASGGTFIFLAIA
jgi:hypothetical protein